MNRTNPEFQPRLGVAFVSDFFAGILLLTSSICVWLNSSKQIIAMKHLIQECNNEAWVGVKPSTLRSWPS